MVPCSQNMTQYLGMQSAKASEIGVFKKIQFLNRYRPCIIKHNCDYFMAGVGGAREHNVPHSCGAVHHCVCPCAHLSISALFTHKLVQYVSQSRCTFYHLPWLFRTISASEVLDELPFCLGGTLHATHYRQV
jgi:hypothetical protein